MTTSRDVSLKTKEKTNEKQEMDEDKGEENKSVFTIFLCDVTASQFIKNMSVRVKHFWYHFADI